MIPEMKNRFNQNYYLVCGVCEAKAERTVTWEEGAFRFRNKLSTELHRVLEIMAVNNAAL
jgi:hypothetical protein